jgi:nucleotide-binding universal stress UspA family protein
MTAMGHIVVGVDESHAAADAVRWAVRESLLRGWSLSAVLAWAFLGQHHGTGDDVFQPDYGEDDAANALEQLLERAVADDDARRSIERRVVCDIPARALLAASTGSDLLVVGARGIGGFRGLLLGSVSQQLAHHTTVPLAIVRADDTASAGADARPVVVGVDGSATSQRALAWALDAANLRGASLTVINAWEPGLTAAVAAVGEPTEAAVDGDPSAGAMVAAMLAAAGRDDVRVPIETRLVADPPARAILEASAGASLVVLGSRGRGGFRGLLLGSVSQHVVNHALCPVVIIPRPH